MTEIAICLNDDNKEIENKTKKNKRESTTNDRQSATL